MSQKETLDQGLSPILKITMMCFVATKYRVMIKTIKQQT